jgi:uncharacterized membrane protein
MTEQNSKMNETEKVEQGQKAKISELAMVSLALGVIGFVEVFVVALFVRGMLTLTGPLIGVIGIALGVEALVKIHRSKGLLKGRIFAICGILTCILGQMLGIYFAGAIVMYGHEVVWRQMCRGNLQELGIAIKHYANDNDNKYPTADK